MYAFYHIKPTYQSKWSCNKLLYISIFWRFAFHFRLMYATNKDTGTSFGTFNQSNQISELCEVQFYAKLTETFSDWAISISASTCYTTFPRCLNGGTCLDKALGAFNYICQCPKGAAGPRCEVYGGKLHSYKSMWKSLKFYNKSFDCKPLITGTNRAVRQRWLICLQSTPSFANNVAW